MFLPQVALAIATSLLGAGLARRNSTKRVYLLGHRRAGTVRRHRAACFR
jgi:hypothetical protein